MLRRAAQAAAVGWWLAVVAGCASTPVTDGSVADSPGPAVAAPDLPAAPAEPPAPATTPPAAAAAEEPAPTPAAVDPLRPERAPRPRRPRRAARPVGTRARRLRDARPRQRAGARPRTLVRHAARLRAAHDRARRPLPVPHRRGSRAPRHADRAGAAALHRKCLQPAGHVVGQGLGHVAVHAGHRQALRAARRTCSATTGATCWPPPAPRSTTWASCTACSATGISRWPPTTGAKATCSARSRATGAPAWPPTTPACACPTRRAYYVPKLQAVKNIVARPAAFGLQLARARQPPVLPERGDRARHRRRPRRAAGAAAAGRVQGAQPADEQAGDPGRRHAAGAAALRQRQPVRARPAAAPRPAGQLDGLGGAEDAAPRRRRASRSA